ncbi:MULTISPECIES: LacI family DNA-binding transcriptional regulator [unclassified Lentimicrobium]|uniref:LacI family DNA-binding transcriptional regulator n=1 Tax=unclassified Lentimicrobium TaxID=2677434 RepID=UPI0015543624|nr:MULTISPECIES: LacI family DNA-binding transcriptional regulator [unclassified Lentimicrobium]NPD45055.1 LacI family DNA-binding transcriptional regulator [Lentimicrobium sp. S6]NPD84547.1 LacI family DNA-binding transcriptional regulator [Lentimicrobium sp. L6]
MHNSLKRFSFVKVKKKKITLSVIAEELKVSKTLVSLVLNGKGDASAINKATQEKVISKARELNYKPNQVARGLRMGTTKTIGLLVADISNPFYARITRTIEHYAEEEGYSLIVCSSDEEQEREKRLVRMLLDRQVDGIIMTTTLSQEDELDSLFPNQYPLVLLDRYLDDSNKNFVGVDNISASKEAINHFINNGHQNIGFLTLTPSYISTLRDRRAGYIEALKENHIGINEDYIIEIDYNLIKAKEYAQIKDFVNRNREITAIFTTNNHLAVACLEAIKELDLKIPEDISIITFDDVELFQYTSPALSTIAQPLADIGHQAVSILMNEIKDSSVSQRTEILQTKLIIRES